MYTCLCFLVCAPECLSPCPPLGRRPLSDSLPISFLHCKQFLPLCLSLIIFLIRENNHFIITNPRKQASWLIPLQ